MKVLHFIPNLGAVSGPNIQRYKPDLFGSMSGRVEVHILTFHDAGRPLGRAAVHACSFTGLLFCNRRTALGKLLAGINPDIVHIHACWSLAAYLLQRWCVRNRKPVVITVDKRMEPWHVRGRYLCKLAKMMLFQRYMLKNADALHVVTEQEEQHLSHQGRRPGRVSRRVLNGRTGLVPIFDRTGEMTSDDMAGALVKLYRKVLDSRPFLSMTEADRRAEDTLLAAGMRQDGAGDAPDGEAVAALQGLDAASWRRILLHASDQGVLDAVKAGCGQCGISLPQVDVEGADRFARGAEGNGGRAKAMLKKKERLHADKRLQGAGLDVCLLLVDVVAKLRAMQVKRADLAALHNAMRYNDYDEALLAAKAREIGISKEASRLFQIMKERYGLGEGFMFLEPLPDRRTGKLRSKLFKSDIQ